MAPRIGVDAVDDVCMRDMFGPVLAADGGDAG
jgi:hypothetical protein